MGNLERHEVLKIEDRGQCQTCLEYQRPGEIFVLVEAFYTALPQKSRSKQSNESTVDSIMYVPGFHNLALKNIQRSPRDENSLESQKRKKARAYLGSAKKQNFGTIEDEQYQVRLHEQRYTQSEWKMNLLHFL